MATLASPIDLQECVINVFGSNAVPTIADVCDLPDVDKKRAAFRAKTPAQKAKDPNMPHYVKCGPCREAFNWGRL